MTYCGNCGASLEEIEPTETSQYWKWCGYCAADQHTYHPHREPTVLYTILIIALIVLAVCAIFYFVRRTPR